MKTYAIETYAAGDDPQSVQHIELPTDLAAKVEGMRIFRQEGWAKVVVWDSPLSGATALVTFGS